MVGQFARFYPSGKKLLEEDGQHFDGVSTKEFVLELMNHESKVVSQQALKCSQIIMCKKWDLLL